MGTGYFGGFGSGTIGSKEQHETEKHSLPKGEAQLRHIFSGKEGHLSDTPENRQLLVDLSNNESKYVGKDKYGNLWNIETTEQGVQNWGRYQNGIINEGGQNASPRTWNDETGLNYNPVKRRKGKK